MRFQTIRVTFFAASYHSVLAEAGYFPDFLKKKIESRFASERKEENGVKVKSSAFG